VLFVHPPNSQRNSTVGSTLGLGTEIPSYNLSLSDLDRIVNYRRPIHGITFSLGYCFSAMVYARLDFDLSTRRSQPVWCHLGEIESFPAMLAQDELAEGDQPGENPIKYSATCNRTLNSGQGKGSEIHSFLH